MFWIWRVGLFAPVYWNPAIFILEVILCWSYLVYLVICRHRLSWLTPFGRRIKCSHYEKNLGNYSWSLLPSVCDKVHFRWKNVDDCELLSPRAFVSPWRLRKVKQLISPAPPVKPCCYEWFIRKHQDLIYGHKLGILQEGCPTKWKHSPPRSQMHLADPVCTAKPGSRKNPSPHQAWHGMLDGSVIRNIRKPSWRPFSITNTVTSGKSLNEFQLPLTTQVASHDGC